MKKHLFLKSLLIAIGLLITSINTAWAWQAPCNMYVIGDPIGGDWTNSSTSYQIATAYGEQDKFYIVVFMETNQYFALSDGSSNRYAPSVEHTPLGIGTSAVQGDYNHNTYSWQYTGPTGLVKICIDQYQMDNTHYPRVWVEKYWDPKDDINAVLTGSKVMFYWGDQYNDGWKSLYNTSNSSETAFWLAERTGSFYVSGSDWTGFRWGAACLSPARYYIRRASEYYAVQLPEDPVAGKGYMVYYNTEHTICVGDNRSTATFTNSGSYSIEYGTANSGVSASIPVGTPTSVIGKTNSIYGYYISVHDANSWSSFDPSDADEIAPGTYDVAAIVTDGVIYVKGATATLTVTETTHTVSVAVSPSGGGTFSHGGSSGLTSKNISGIGMYSASTTITAVPANLGWRFKEWNIPSGVTIASGSATDESITIHASADSKTITAVFEPKFGLFGSKKDNSSDGGMPGWSTAADFAVTSYTSASSMSLNCTRNLEPNTEYRFQVKDRQYDTYRSGNADGTMAANSSWTLTGSNKQIYYKTAGYGDYRFEITQINGSNQPSIHIIRPTSYGITIGTLTSFNEGASSTTDGTGGSISAKTTESAVDYTINNGDSIRSGGTAVFTANHADGYTFAGWYTNSTCTTPYTSGAGVTISDNVLTLSSIGANKAVYAKFEEIMSSVYMFTTRGTFKIDDGSATSEVDNPYLKVGVHTTHTVTVLSANTGYYFSGWDLHTSPDKTLNTSISGSGEDNTTITVRGLGNTEGHSLDFLYPEYKDLEKIYFRNVFDDGTNPVTHWAKVYVYFDITWAAYGGQQAVKTSSENNTKGLYAEMSAVGSKDLYWAYVPRWITRNNKVNVAFANMENTSNSGYLYNGKASGRADYKKELNVFVPYHVANKTNANSVDYYDNGFWYYYDYAPKGKASGYKLGRRTGSKAYSWEDNEFTITNQSWEDPKIQYNLRIDNVSKDQYIIKAVSAGITYKANATVSAGACDNVDVVEDKGDDAYFTLTPTTEGEYVITIDQSGDRMKISVNYPVAVNDYVVEHTYKGRNKDNSADSTYTTRSNVIKYAVAADSARYSLYLNNAGATLKLRKCTAISGEGVPTWTEVDADSNTDNISDGLAAIMTKVGTTPGVYEFDLKVDKTNDEVGELKNIALYSGNYYIKTDSASGGWVNYKDNAMDKNTVTFDRTAATFDNYWCHYYYTNAGNIKCVIANEYCNQLSDTIKGDGIARMSGKEPFVPKAGTSIRFSYNSATNTIGRAYLDKSLDNDYLNIVPNATGKVFKLDGTDLYDAEEDNYVDTRFDDKLNWVYEKEVLVVPGAEAGVSATFNDASSVAHKQMFLPKTYTLLGGSGKGKYRVRVVYDFKTNFMMAAFLLPDTAITTALSDFDMLWVRHKDYSPDQIKLGTGGSLSNVRVIGAIELRYDSVHYNGSGLGHVDMNTWGPDNRPFLKYFVSFPFDVHVSSIFGLNQARLGYDYDIQKYDGATRAKEGLFFGDGDNYWINLTKDSVMHANEGYCIIFDNDYVSGHLGHIWDNKESGSKVYLYFPADEEMESIVTDEDESNVPAHQCNVNRWWAQYAERNHMQTDSHWNMIGNPLFHDAHIKSTVDGVKDSTLHSYYKLDYSDNKWKAVAITKNSTPFKAMSSVLVQWCGDITWTAIPDPSPIVARRVNAENKNYLIQLDVEFNGAVSDWAYVQLREGSDADFKLCEDMYKMYNKGIPQIYTFAGAYDVAYNDVPIQNQTIPVGIVTRKNGTYKFSMPTNFSGTVTLIDKFAQTRTNLNIDDYEVYLEKGTIEDRFELEINIIQAPTAIDGVEDGEGTLKDGKAHKFIMNDMMYILRDGEIFDARGNRIK